MFWLSCRIWSIEIDKYDDSILSLKSWNELSTFPLIFHPNFPRSGCVARNRALFSFCGSWFYWYLYLVSLFINNVIINLNYHIRMSFILFTRFIRLHKFDWVFLFRVNDELRVKCVHFALSKILWWLLLLLQCFGNKAL